VSDTTALPIAAAAAAPQPGRVRRNIAANYAGGIWATLISLALIPVYIRFLGAEAYGLIGVFTMIQALLGLLDLGIGTTFNRELARLAVAEERPGQARTLVRTLETVYWAIGAVIALGLFALAGFLAHDWVRADALPLATVHDATRLMAVAMLFQWPVVLYSGGLQGLQQHVRLNMITASALTLRGVGAVIVLAFISPTVQAFFIWQIVASLVHVAALRVGLWSVLPRSSGRVHFDAGELRRVWRFAAGMTGISAVTLILTQADKLVLSRMLSLEMFGYYSIAYVAASALYRLITPVFGAVFPRLSELVRADDQAGLTSVFHRGSQLVSLLVFPAAAVLAMFAADVLLLWTRDPLVVRHGATVLSLAAVGVALNGAVNVPYALQLAHGWTRLTLLTNTVAVIVLVPATILAVRAYGVVGAAGVWVVLNAAYYVIYAQLMFRRLLPSEKWRWYGVDTLAPLLAALGVAGLGKLAAVWLQPATLPLLLLMGVTSVLAVLAAAATAPWLWQEARQWLRQRSGSSVPRPAAGRP
jgi:O-antigen/teichoic acid export membrane protein